MLIFKSIKTFVFILLVFSTLLAIAGIRGFYRLAPSIEHINSHNTHSLYVAEKMMSAFAVKKDIQQFETALEQGRLNITESGEADAIANIEAEYKNAFLDNKQSQNVVIDNIINLTKINRLAMQQEAVKAKNISSAAAWLITFLTIFTWFIGFGILNTLQRHLFSPVNEIINVLDDYKKGNKLRRCPRLAPNKIFQSIFNNINEILDK